MEQIMIKYIRNKFLYHTNSSIDALNEFDV